jgi:pimeloyl-ACP methyl ester carboxylesterase
VDAGEWKQAGRRFYHRGYPVFYREEGEGRETIVFLHGFPTASWDWHRLWPVFRGRYRLVTLDFLGFGFSAKPRDYHYSLLDQAELLATLLAALGVASAHLLAHDYGAAVAQELLARQEAGQAGSTCRLRSVCWLNGGLFPQLYRATPAQRLLLSPAGPLLGRLLSERRFAAELRGLFAPDTGPDDEDIASFWALLSTEDGGRVIHRLLHYIAESRLHADRWLQAMQGTRVPLRLINGSLDPLAGEPMAERYCALIPEPDVVRLHTIGHYPHMEAPMMVAQEYIRFLRRARTRT